MVVGGGVLREPHSALCKASLSVLLETLECQNWSPESGMGGGGVKVERKDRRRVAWI